MRTEQLFCETHRDSLSESAKSICRGSSISPNVGSARNLGIPGLRNIPAALGPSGVLPSRARITEASAILMSMVGKEQYLAASMFGLSLPLPNPEEDHQARVHDA